MYDWNEYFVYNESSPSCLVWKKTDSPKFKPGDPLKYMNDSGYYQVRIFGRLYRCHRIIWEMFHGPIPEGSQIDHRDTNRANNKIDNLRLATNSQNCANRGPNKRKETSGFKGVSWRPDRKKWRAYIVKQQKQVALGNFDSELEAAKAYNQAAIVLFGEFAKLNQIEK